MSESDIKVNVQIENYDELHEKARRLVDLLNEANTIVKEIADVISGTDFLSLS